MHDHLRPVAGDDGIDFRRADVGDFVGNAGQALRRFRHGERDRRAVSIEVGIQNSALGLILIFNFFDGLGGMAIVTAWWGIWHIISGLTVSTIWSKRDPQGAP